MRNFFYKSLFIIVPALLLGAQHVWGAEGFSFLQPLPGLSASGDPKTLAQQYIPAIIKLSIAIAAAVAVVRIIYGGIQYMATDSFSKKGEGKKTIQEALWGLMLVISSFVILGTVNPDLIKDITISLPTITVSNDFVTRPPGTSPLTPLPPDTEYAVGCSNCVRVPISFNQKPPGFVSGTSGCKPVNPINGAEVPHCLASEGVVRKLVDTSILFSTEDYKIYHNEWQINEMWPPTVGHRDPCHKDGTCIDIKLINTSNNNKLYKFLSGLQVNFSVLYEVPDQTRKDQLLRDYRFRRFGIIVTQGVGEHAHIK